MSGFKIFAKAIELVVNNWKAAAQIVVVPTLLAIGVSILMVLSTRGPGGGAIGFATVVFFVAAVMIFVFLWMAVAWHRFILLSEYPSGGVPAIKPDRIVSYFVHGLLIVLALAVVLIPALLLIGAISGASSALFLLFGLVFYVIGTLLFYRLSPILPAAAIGKPLSVSGAWSATGGQTKTLIGLTVAGALFGIVVGLVSTLVGWLPVIGSILDLFLQTFAVLVGVSVLSTIYGVFIEGRTLD